MTTFDQIAGKIIKEQELIIGPLAWAEARNVAHLRVLDEKAGTIAIEEGANGRAAIDELVNRYVELFGRAARETCKEAAVSLIADLSPTDVPASLK